MNTDAYERIMQMQADKAREIGEILKPQSEAAYAIARLMMPLPEPPKETP